MHEPELPDSVVSAIEKRVRRRILRHLTMVVLTCTLIFLVVWTPTIANFGVRHNWEAAFWAVLYIWIPYAIWYVYQALVERGVRREIEREYQRQIQLARAGRRFKREERYAHLAGLVDDREAFLADDGELWFEDEDKPKRRLDF
jgi:hypothetical protein